MAHSEGANGTLHAAGVFADDAADLREGGEGGREAGREGRREGGRRRGLVDGKTTIKRLNPAAID